MHNYYRHKWFQDFEHSRFRNNLRMNVVSNVPATYLSIILVPYVACQHVPYYFSAIRSLSACAVLF
jgi:hypothetical protein